METLTYPVHVRGRLDGDPSRGLWLVKWLLLIPHAIVLFFLWIAFVVVSILAFFSILFSGRYPRGLFDFNVGVLRWSWRVWFYGYGALGTDRYPPFSLHDVPDYPAGLEVDYPERLSHGLIFVKWLLAIPHCLVLSFLTGGGLYLASNSAGSSSRDYSWGGGLVVLLSLIAAFALLFTGSYPRTIFDLVVGMDRWALRVAGYLALMTDQYPPFRLDQGGAEPDSVAPPDQPAAPSSNVADPARAGV